MCFDKFQQLTALTRENDDTVFHRGHSVAKLFETRFGVDVAFHAKLFCIHDMQQDVILACFIHGAGESVIEIKHGSSILSDEIRQA